MRATILCDPYLWEKPSILLRTSFFYTTNTVCVSELVNQIALVTLTLGVAAALLHRFVTRSKTPMLVLLLLGLFLTAPSMFAISASRREGFQNKKVEGPAPGIPKVDVIGSADRVAGAVYTGPTARNPFMNVLVDEVKYNPTRPSAASVQDPTVQITMDDYFRTEFARDPTDVFGRNQSQREFITMPSTSIPNDVDSYQNWLYRIPGKTCKEGGREACLPGTDGAAIPWLNQNQ